MEGQCEAITDYTDKSKIYMFLTLIMGIFNLFASPDLSYKEFEKWVDSSLNTELPKDVVAFCFNLYDDGNGQWSVELVGTSSFDKDDSDWACNEVFDTRNNPLKWKSKESWKKVLSSVRSHLETYLKNGKHASLLRSQQGIGLGFVDGDLIIL